MNTFLGLNQAPYNKTIWKVVTIHPHINKNMWIFSYKPLLCMFFYLDFSTHLDLNKLGHFAIVTKVGCHEVLNFKHGLYTFLNTMENVSCLQILTCAQWVWG